MNRIDQALKNIYLAEEILADEDSGELASSDGLSISEVEYAIRRLDKAKAFLVSWSDPRSGKSEQKQRDSLVITK
jgi:hypothetical protein